MKNKKDRMVVRIAYAAIIVIIFIFSCNFMPKYILLGEYPYQFALVFAGGILVGAIISDAVYGNHS